MGRDQPGLQYVFNGFCNFSQRLLFAAVNRAPFPPGTKKRGVFCLQNGDAAACFVLRNVVCRKGPGHSRSVYTWAKNM